MAELDLEKSLPIAFGLDLSERQDQLEKLVFDLVRLEDGVKGPTKDAMALLIANLLRCSWFLGDGFLAYPRNHNAYGGPIRYREVEIGHEAFLRSVNILTARNLVQNYRGVYRPDGEGRVSRLRMQPELEDRLGEAGLLGWCPARKRPKEVLILRAKGGWAIDYTDCDETRRKRNELEDFNSMLSGHVLTLDGYAWPSQEANLVRIFSRGDFALGGRHYRGWWQYDVGKDERGQIQIDGAPTVELDYSGQHIYMLYALHANQQYRGDPYALPNPPPIEGIRTVVKLALLIAANARSKRSALLALQAQVEEELKQRLTLDELEAVLVAVLEKHKPIRDRVFKDDGIKLQGKDSEIMASVMDKATRADIPVLPVHDSVICREDDKEVLEVWMKESYAEHMGGFEAEVKCKQRPYEARQWRFRPGSKEWRRTRLQERREKKRRRRELTCNRVLGDPAIRVSSTDISSTTST